MLAGTAFPPGEHRTCSNRTSNDEVSAMPGRQDRHSFFTLGSSWNAAHPSRDCSGRGAEAMAPVLCFAGSGYGLRKDYTSATQRTIFIARHRPPDLIDSERGVVS